MKQPTIGDLGIAIIEAACQWRDIGGSAGQDDLDLEEALVAMENAVDAYREALRRQRPWKADLAESPK